MPPESGPSRQRRVLSELPRPARRVEIVRRASRLSPADAGDLRADTCRNPTRSHGHGSQRQLLRRLGVVAATGRTFAAAEGEVPAATRSSCSATISGEARCLPTGRPRPHGADQRRRFKVVGVGVRALHRHGRLRVCLLHRRSSWPTARRQEERLVETWPARISAQGPAEARRLASTAQQPSCGGWAGLGRQYPDVNRISGSRFALDLRRACTRKAP